MVRYWIYLSKSTSPFPEGKLPVVAEVMVGQPTPVLAEQLGTFRYCE
jgi:hypothetical protein